jgi:hypothetical protein
MAATIDSTPPRVGELLAMMLRAAGMPAPDLADHAARVLRQRGEGRDVAPLAIESCDACAAYLACIGLNWDDTAAAIAAADAREAARQAQRFADTLATDARLGHAQAAAIVAWLLTGITDAFHEAKAEQVGRAH